ncbi:hypothetical protein OIU79_016367 [Salix purpurea]|uniref:Uncharacterized protein n=1 Tax=Salix purpurea TaxID=77065 RepID=A0A9Q0SRB8_SALPP|nr:hypothetical protein OIU79_016367 [Salix purpurea]
MKPHNLSGDGSLPRESKRTIGGRLKQAVAAASASMNMAKNGAGKGKQLSFVFKRNEKTKLELSGRGTYKNYDVLRVMGPYMNRLSILLDSGQTRYCQVRSPWMIEYWFTR